VPEWIDASADAARRRAGILSIVVLVVGSALLLQAFGFNQGAHYSLVKALAHGTPRIDDFQAYSGDESWYHGHYFSNKAPGVAFLCLPFYLLLKAAGLPSGVHVLALLASVLPALALFVLVRRIADDWERGFGTAAAVTLAAGTLFLPFTSLLFAHVLSSFLGFAAFALLWRERSGPSRLALLGAAGALAGLAVTTEYPLALVGFVLGLYAISRAPIVRRGLAYAAGVFAGVLPLLLYQRWAFGSFTHLAYSNVVTHRGKSGHDVVKGSMAGFHDVAAPRARPMIELLFSERGLVRLMPVLALGVLGTIMLYRRGRRAEALVVAGVSILTLAYDTGFVDPFGGWGPGPRYLMPMMPFLALSLVLVYARAPLTTAALALCSVVFMVVATATEPLLPNNLLTFSTRGDVADTGLWFHRFGSGDFTRTVLTSAGAGHGWIAIAPFLLAVCAAVVLAVRATRPVRLERRDVETAAVAVVGWLLVAIDGPSLLKHDRAVGSSLGAIAVVLLVSAVVLTAVRVNRSGLLSVLPALPLLAFAFHRLAHRPGLASGIALAVLVATAVLERRALAAWLGRVGGKLPGFKKRPIGDSPA
jgi:hypothetical protein